MKSNFQLKKINILKLLSTMSHLFCSNPFFSGAPPQKVSTGLWKQLEKTYLELNQKWLSKFLLGSLQRPSMPPMAPIWSQPETRTGGRMQPRTNQTSEDVPQFEKPCYSIYAMHGNVHLQYANRRSFRYQESFSVCATQIIQEHVCQEDSVQAFKGSERKCMNNR